jgi:hypothetical protein
MFGAGYPISGADCRNIPPGPFSLHADTPDIPADCAALGVGVANLPADAPPVPADAF